MSKLTIIYAKTCYAKFLVRNMNLLFEIKLRYDLKLLASYFEWKANFQTKDFTQTVRAFMTSSKF